MARMDRGWNSDFVFNIDSVKHRCRICWLLFAASFVWSDWPLGLLWKASWHYVLTVILRHSWLYWHGSVVLTQKIWTSIHPIPNYRVKSILVDFLWLNKANFWLKSQETFVFLLSIIKVKFALFIIRNLCLTPRQQGLGPVLTISIYVLYSATF